MEHSEKQTSFIFLIETYFFGFRDGKEMTREQIWFF
jgi:hypothetical protein